MRFDFVDLFAGVGGFHAVLGALGGRGVLAAEIDPHAALVYERNWGLKPESDVVELASRADAVPEHQILTGGFPCQPFSKGGHQKGMSELRGQLFNEILKILRVRRPAVVFLENVRNLAGPRQRPVWEAIISGLRESGYRVPSEPAVFSPHLLPPRLGGSPQVRDRVYILGTYVGRERALNEVDVEPVVARCPVDGWDPHDWSLERDLLVPQYLIPNRATFEITADDMEYRWFTVWQAFLDSVRPARLPGFPMWSMYWHNAACVDATAPSWKQVFERKNIEFYRANKTDIDAWLKRYGSELKSFPASRQKLEWQAQNSVRRLDQCLLHLRPSGIRAKEPTYTPALVAMAQTPVYGPEMRRLVPREAARLQGFPDWFGFGDQPDIRTYKQMGNAIHIGAAYYVLRQHIVRDAPEVESAGGADFVRAVKDSPGAPDVGALPPARGSTSTN